MADVQEDPRETPAHPRFASQLVGHEASFLAFAEAFASGKPHHAWLLTGPHGIGKATFAYKVAQHVLSQSAPKPQVEKWLHARAHPDFAVLERTLNDSKPKRLRAEIGVDDARAFIDFFSRTSSNGGWRIGLVDSTDDLNTESANALLKLVEEPPAKALILLVSHAPGKLLRTLRSRCRRLPLQPLSDVQTQEVLEHIPREKPPNADELSKAVAIAGGSPGRALQLMESEGAKAFQQFLASKRLDASARNAIGQHFSNRAAAIEAYEVFIELVLGWTADKAKSTSNIDWAALHQRLAQQQGIVSGYNLDRRVAVMEALAEIDRASTLALKVA